MPHHAFKARMPHTVPFGGGSPFPNLLAFLDTETCEIEIEKGAKAVVFAFGRVLFVELGENLEEIDRWWSYFDTQEAAIALFDSHRSVSDAIWVFGHNISYDLARLGLLDALVGRGWDLTNFYMSRTTNIFKLSLGHAHMNFLDTQNFLPGALKKYEGAAGVDKVEVDFERLFKEAWLREGDDVGVGRYDPNHPETQILHKRNISDCEMIASLMLKWLRFVRGHGLGGFAMSAAGQAFVGFRSKHMEHQIKVHGNQEVDAFEIDSYKGGIVRCFRIGKFSGDTYYKLDVNSMYSSVMWGGEFPVRLRGGFDNPSQKRLEALLRYYSVIADVEVSPKSDTYQHKTQAGCLYPAYPFRGVFCTPELKMMLERDEIKEVHKLNYYSKRCIFKSYVDAMFEEKSAGRASGDKFRGVAGKMLLNGLYGKFGGYQYNWVRREDLEGGGEKTDYVLEQASGQILRVYWIGGKAYTDEKVGLAFHSFPAISAHVTSFARVKLWSLIWQAGRENVFYCDTDSLIVNMAGFQRLQAEIDDCELGKMKIEEVADELEICSRKDYKIGQKQVIKGLPVAAREIRPGLWESEYLPSLRSVSAAKGNKLTRLLKRTFRRAAVCWDGTVGKNGEVHAFTSPPNFLGVPRV